MSTATQKQINFAKAIAKRLQMQLPRGTTKEVYREFISANIDEFNRRTPPLTGSATEKQMLFVKRMTAVLAIPPPDDGTKEAYRLFIEAHIEEFRKASKHKYRIERRGFSECACGTVPEEFRYDIEGPIDDGEDRLSANRTDFVYDDLLLPQD